MSVISAPELLLTPRGYPPEWKRVFEALTAPINLVREISQTASSNGFHDLSAGKKENEPRLSTDEILRFRKQISAVQKHVLDVLSEIEGVAEKTWRAGREIRTITSFTLNPLTNDSLAVLDRMTHPGQRSAEYARIIDTVIEQSRRLLPIPLLLTLRDAIAAEKSIELPRRSTVRTDADARRSSALPQTPNASEGWTKHAKPLSEWAPDFGIDYRTLKKRIADGIFLAKQHGRRWIFAIHTLPPNVKAKHINQQ